ncbi:MAG TPA: hypothetical protein VEA69_17025, partial [Tepidisphaeraceae bacterium]|nr:hypothetical protein [Tepidisphaeraceae bacterium]
MTAHSPPVPPPLPAIDRDLACVGCGYNLRTMPVTGRCPECARAVADSVPRGVTPWHDRSLGTLVTTGAWLAIGSTVVFLV